MDDQFADFAGKTYTGDTGAFYFDNIGAEDVKIVSFEADIQIIPFYL